MSSNPLMLERAALWRCRRQRFFASKLEASFSIGVAILATAAAVAALAAWAAEHGAELLSAAERYSVALLMLAYSAATAALISHGTRVRERALKNWLAALLTPTQLRSVLRFDVLTNTTAVSMLANLLLLACWFAQRGKTAAPWTLMVGLVAAFAAAAPSALWVLQRQSRNAAARQAGAMPSRIAPKARTTRAIGGLAAWQSKTMIRNIRGSTLARPAAMVALLIPGAESWPTTLALLLAGVFAILMLAAWRQAMETTRLASLWLKAQPLSATQLLWPLLLPALALAGVGSGIASAVLIFLGLGSSVALLVWLAVMAIAALHAACVAAYRYRARLSGLRFSICLTLLLALLQSYPPLTPLAWLATIASLALQARRA
jgi:hypothetical protein